MTDPNPLQPTASDEQAAAKTAAEGAPGVGEKVTAKPVDKAPPAAAAGARPQIDSMRETLESIAVAFILAFLFRTFVAEAFVIPTGSMATTLMGRHKDIECPNCKFRYETSASAEADKEGNVKPGVRVEKTICPNCGMPVDTSNEEKFPSYRGDRIIVSKVDTRGPRRWDVIVFRFPQEAGTNYIKRLVGLPGEELQILRGDLYSRPMGDGNARFRILRKPPEVVLAMLRDVYDNDHIANWMTDDARWPPRWQPCPLDIQSLVDAGWSMQNQSAWPWPATSQTPGQWTTSDGYRSFAADGSAKGDVWLRYQHYLPGDDDWKGQLINYAPAGVLEAFHPDERTPKGRQEFRESTLAIDKANRPPVRPRLWPIGDFTGYNYGDTNHRSPEYGQGDHAWVGDLAVGCEVAPRAEQGEVVLELIKAGHRFHCALNLADRSVRLSIDDGAVRFADENGAAAENAATAKNALPKGKPFRVLFANVDGQLHVWINEGLVTFEGPTTYDLPVAQETTADLSPVGIASRGADVTVNHVRVLRDVYYLTRPGAEASGDRFTLEKNGNNPDADQFFVLGDNSAASADARSWTNREYVERKLLIGKALFIFWPHSWDSPVPFTPNWKRMRFIR